MTITTSNPRSSGHYWYITWKDGTKSIWSALKWSAAQLMDMRTIRRAVLR